MDIVRSYHTLRLWMIKSATKRAAYLKKHDLLGYIGENCRWGPRKLPLYPKLIKLHNNVGVQKTVSFITHDMLNRNLKNAFPNFLLQKILYKHVYILDVLLYHIKYL